MILNQNRKIYIYEVVECTKQNMTKTKPLKIVVVTYKTKFLVGIDKEEHYQGKS